MNKLHDLTSNVEYIRELINQYKEGVLETSIPLYYVTDDELTSILAHYDSAESIQDALDNYYTKTQIDLLLSNKADTDTYATGLQFNKSTNLLTLTRNDGTALSAVIDIDIPQPVDATTIADLTNQIDSFPVNKQNKTIKDWQFYTAAHIFYSADKQIITQCTAVSDNNNITITVSGIGTTEAVIQVNVPANTQFDQNVNVSIDITCQYGSKVTTFTLVPLVAGEDGAASVRYYLQPSLSQIKIKSDNTYSDYSVECYKMVQVGNSSPQQTTNLILRMSIDGGAEQDYSQIILSQAQPKFKIQYSLYNNDNVLYDRETIVVVKDGAKGDTGQRGPKGDDGESESLSYGISFNQTTVGEGATNIGLTVWKIDNDGYSELNASNCSVQGLYEATNCIFVDANDKFYFEYTNGVVLNENYTAVLYVDGNAVARTTLAVIKNRSTQINIKKWSDVAIGDQCYAENAVSDNIALADVVIDDVYNTGKHLCVKTYRKLGHEDIYNTEYWQPFNEYKNIATELILADKAYVKNLLLNYATAIDGEGKETVSIDGETGKLTVIDGQFTGSVAVPFTIITEDNFDEYVKLMPGSSDAYYIDFSNAHCNIQINYWRNPSALPTYHIVLPQETLDDNYGKEIKIINYIPEKLTLKVKNPSWIDTNNVLHENLFYNGYKIEYGYEATFKLVEMATYVKQKGSTVGYQFKSFADNNGNPTDNCWRLTEKNSHISTEDANYNTPVVFLETSNLVSAANKAWIYGSLIVLKDDNKLYHLYKRVYANDEWSYYFFNNVDDAGWMLDANGWSPVYKQNM